MTRTELLAQARVRLDDEVIGSYLYTDAQLQMWADEAVQEACRRSRILSDNATPINVVSGTSEYLVPTGTIFIRRAILAGEDIPLCENSYNVLDEDVAGWQDHTGTPREYLTDMRSNYLYLYPTPDSNYSLNLVIIREPILGDIIEIPNRFHYGLIDWVCFRAYQVKDSDAENRLKSMEHYQLFGEEFGDRSSAKDELFQARQRPFSGVDGTY